MSEELFERIRQRPWNSHAFALPDWHKHYPTMLTREEMRMLAWIAGNVAIDGAIVDLGCFLGGSSVSLAWGAAETGRRRRIYAYDRFLLDEKLKFTFLYKKGHGFAPGADALPVFRNLTRPFARDIEIRAGDICEKTWQDGAIAVLFIDLSKTKAINDHLLTTFFPHLRPGSVIIQQDFLFIKSPWLYPTMLKLSDSIEMLSHTEDHSVIFGVRETPSPAALARCLSRNTTYQETVEAIGFFRARFTNIRQIEVVDAVLASLNAAPDADKAWQIPNASGLRLAFESD